MDSHFDAAPWNPLGAEEAAAVVGRHGDLECFLGVLPDGVAEGALAGQGGAGGGS